jgi:hypothetical protein
MSSVSSVIPFSRITTAERASTRLACTGLQK